MHPSWGISSDLDRHSLACAGGAPLSATASASGSLRKLLNSDPNTAAPNELPIVRKNVTPEVAPWPQFLPTSS
jgi:hypothetical protein